MLHFKMDSHPRTPKYSKYGGRLIQFFLLSTGVISIFYGLTSVMSQQSTKTQETFLYFAYGSNMLAERIHIKNPTAKLAGIGTLQNYRFGFERVLELPQEFGAIATVRKATSKDRVMGVVWEIDWDQVGNLDEQEQHYRAIEVDVQLQDGRMVKCRTYEMESEAHTSDFRPHPFYQKICVEGAKQHHLPEEYVQFLQGFENTQQPRPEGFYDPLVPVFERMEKEDM